MRLMNVLRLGLLLVFGLLAGCGENGINRILTGPTPTPTPTPLPATPTPKPGAWMWEKKGRGMLDATPKRR